LWALVLAIGVASGSARAATVEVGTCSHFPVFATIQAAVTAANPGSTVLVCPGIYPEQVTIAKRLTLQGAVTATASGAIITAPAGGVVANTTSLSSGNPIAAQVLVQNANDVDIDNMTVDGSNNLIAGCSPNLIGIYYQNASGEISRSAVLNQALSAALNGCQSGLGIFAQSGSGGSSTLEVEYTVVQGYQKNGITGNEAGTVLRADYNSVNGQGPTTGAAENGIQIGFGATGRILGNSVIDDIWAPDTIADPGDAAAGILVFAASSVTINENHVGNAQFGIAVVSDPSGLASGNTISSNKVTATHIFDGIEICSNSNSIHDNVVSRSDESGIHLDSGCTNPNSSTTGKANSVKRNIVNSACAGILVGSGTSAAANFIAQNDLFNVQNTILSGDSCPAVAAAAALQSNALLASPAPRQSSPARP
jgi:hypothetical protein